MLADAILGAAPYVKQHGGRIVIPIHDELVFHFPEQPSPAVVAGIADAMTSHRFSIPLTVSPKVGRNLLALK